jgi:hypothetical protein
MQNRGCNSRGESLSGGGHSRKYPPIQCPNDYFFFRHCIGMPLRQKASSASSLASSASDYELDLDKVCILLLVLRLRSLEASVETVGYFCRCGGRQWRLIPLPSCPAHVAIDLAQCTSSQMFVRWQDGWILWRPSNSPSLVKRLNCRIWTQKAPSLLHGSFTTALSIFTLPTAVSVEWLHSAVDADPPTTTFAGDKAWC